jgi:hypothetical protein
LSLDYILGLFIKRKEDTTMFEKIGSLFATFIGGGSICGAIGWVIAENSIYAIFQTLKEKIEDPEDQRDQDIFVNHHICYLMGGLFAMFIGAAVIAVGLGKIYFLVAGG